MKLKNETHKVIIVENGFLLVQDGELNPAQIIRYNRISNTDIDDIIDLIALIICLFLFQFQEEMSDIHYIPDPNMDQTIESMNQIPPNSTTANNSNSKIRFLMPKFGARKEKDHLKDRRPSKTLDQLMRRYQEHVDANALIVFPIAFLLFNIGYWVHYLIFRQQT